MYTKSIEPRTLHRTNKLRTNFSTRANLIKTFCETNIYQTYRAKNKENRKIMCRKMRINLNYSALTQSNTKQMKQYINKRQTQPTYDSNFAFRNVLCAIILGIVLDLNDFAAHYGYSVFRPIKMHWFSSSATAERHSLDCGPRERVARISIRFGLVRVSAVFRSKRHFYLERQAVCNLRLTNVMCFLWCAMRFASYISYGVKPRNSFTRISVKVKSLRN